MQILISRSGLVLNPGQMADLVLAWRQVAGLIAGIPQGRPLVDDAAYGFRLAPPGSQAAAPKPSPKPAAKAAAKPQSRGKPAAAAKSKSRARLKAAAKLQSRARPKVQPKPKAPARRRASGGR